MRRLKKLIFKLCLSLFTSFLSIWLKTLRYRPEGDEINTQGIILFLHGHQFALLLHRPTHPLITPISLSKDGDLQVQIMARFGIDSVRGSQSRGAVGVLKGLLKSLKNGRTALIALDGSKGPYGIPQPGGFFLANKTTLPLWFCYISSYRGIRLKTWDRFILPYPFSTVHIRTLSLQTDLLSTSEKDSTAVQNKSPYQQDKIQKLSDQLALFIREKSL